jgi:ADP-heptose:LPS heptosyltransferase
VFIDGIVMAVTDPSSAELVYVLRALGLGDLLTAVPALRGLRAHFPAARLALAAPPGLRELAMLTGAVDELVPTTGLDDVFRLDRTPTLAVNLHGCGPQSIEHVLALQPAAVLTYEHERHPDVGGPSWRADMHEVDRWCALLDWAGISCNAGDLMIDRPQGYRRRRGVIVLHPGAAAPARRWPADRFAAVAAELDADGHDVVITGSADERDLALEVARGAGLSESAVLAGALDLLGLVALVADCQLVVCGDTGVAHVATATKTPSVVLFGPTPPSRWGPRSDRHLVLWAGEVGDPHDDRPHSGLLSLSTAHVLSITRTALGDCA